MNLKKPISFHEQMLKLKEHGMKIEDENMVEEILSRVNYYRLSGYLLQYRKSESDSDFINDLDFADAYEIYCFDEELRNILKVYLEKVEVFYRTQIAYHFSMIKCKEPPYDQHYDENNFYNKDGYNKVMADFHKQEAYYRDSLVMKHHKKKYNSKLPLWVMLEMISFSDLSKLYKSMYISEKTIVADYVKMSYTRLENNLHCLSVLRNKCAHAARLYNSELKPAIKFTKGFLQNNPDINNSSLFAYIVMLIMHIPGAEDKNNCINDIISLTHRYSKVIDLCLMGYPENWEKVLTSYIK